MLTEPHEPHRQFHEFGRARPDRHLADCSGLVRSEEITELARGMGQAVKEFQKAKDEFSDELHKAGE